MAQAYALQSAPYNQSNASYKREARLVVCVSFASGVPTVVAARSAPGVTVAGDAGVYTGTMPKCARAILNIQLLTATAAGFATVTTLAPTAGTFSFKTFLHDGTALDVATGDEVFLYFVLEGG